MKNLLESFVGTTIAGITFIHDYVQIFADNGEGMTINNPISLFDKCNNKAFDITSIDVATILMLIQGKTIVSVDFRKGEYVKFILDNGAKISVSLLDKDYTCPEAMYFDHDGITVVVQ